MRTFGISGWVLDQKTAHGLPGLRVEAWDREQLCPDLVDCAMTDDDGRLELSVSEQHVQDLFGERLPELTFRVFCLPEGALERDLRMPRSCCSRETRWRISGSS